MFKNVLLPVALDHDSDIPGTIQFARSLLAEGGKITLLSVVEQVPSYVAEYVTVKPETKLIGEVKDRLAALGKDQPDLEAVVVRGNPGVAIREFASTCKADLIVVGSHRPGLQDYFLGSTASRVVRRAPCAVLVLR